MKNKAIKLHRHIDSDVRKGDIVKIWDGSALVPYYPGDKNYFIIFSYPEITGSEEILEEIECKVLEIGVDDFVSPTIGCLNECHLLDIVIQVGKAKFRTCSQFVNKI